MMESNLSTFKELGANIRIVGLNSDKTRMIDGSNVVYDVCFELSGTPPQAWGTLFEGEWKALNATQPSLWQAARVDLRFLVMRCPLRDVAPMHLPFLKKAVAETNNKYEQYVQDLATERKERQGVWERERGLVDAMEQTLQF
jgi:hypothetical protein